MIFIAWWLTGMLGGLLLWFSWKLDFPDEVGRCPTRRGALGILLYGVLGAVGLFAALIVYFISWLDHRPASVNKWNTWWNKPIC